LRSDRDLGRLASPPKEFMDEVLDRLSVLRAKLRVLENEKRDGSFRHVDDATKIPSGQTLLDAIMSECFCFCSEIQT
jgi:hypothetical protein